jgi:2-oxoacid:acceptor oxidoreductase delta subunit (pyruvate/2-ketoisovalerate family)
MSKPEEILTQKWNEIPRGGYVLEAGNTIYYDTGSWGTFKPVLIEDICIHCFQCWVFCPDCAIIVENEKVVGFDLLHCKGCGICAEICPTKPEKAIVMEKKEI